jgi:hypothetical protein
MRFSKDGVLIAGCIRRFRALFFAALLYAALWSSAPAAVVELDTRNVGSPAIALALKHAFQLPIWIEGMRTGGPIAPDELDHAFARERARLQRLMVGFGYLDAEVALDRSSTRAVFQPVLGKAYTIATVELKGVQHNALDRRAIDDLASIIDDYIGQPATAQIADDLGRRILYRVGETDFALASLRHVKWDHAGDGVVTALVHLDAGPKMSFGTVTFDGLRRLCERDLSYLIPFSPGQRYERDKIEEMRESLEDLANVETVHVGTSAGGRSGASLDLTVRLRETPATLTLPEPEGMFGLASGLATLAGLACLLIAAHAGITRTRLRPVAWLTAALALTFAGLAIHRLVNFL